MSEWRPNLDTENSIDHLLATMLREFPHLLGIDESIPNCEIIDMDPDGTSPAVPRPIIASINTYNQTVIYRGFPSDLAVADYVTVLHMAKGDTYEILGAGGSTGSVPSGGGVSTPPHFSSGDILLNLTFDHLKFSMDDDEEKYMAPRFYYLTSRRDRAWLWPSSTSFHSRCPASRPPSLWRFRRAFRADLAAANMVSNPSFEVNTTGWSITSGSIARVMEYAWSQVWSLRCLANAQFAWTGYQIVPGAGTYSASLWLKADSPDVSFLFYNLTLGAPIGRVWHPGDGQWHRLVVNNGSVGAGENIGLLVQDSRAGGWTPYYIDAAQLEPTAYHTPYFDGDQGDGMYWTGTNHASWSYQTSGYVNLVDMVETISERESFAVRCVVQVPYDADFAYWPTDPSPIWDARGANDNNRIQLRYDSTSDTFDVFINGAVMLSSSAQTFTEGEWLDIVIKFQFGLYDEYELWINGVEEDTNSSIYALSAPTLTNWQLGSDIVNINYQCNWTFAEYTVYESAALLTETLIGQLYLTGPTIDPESVLEDRITPPAFWDHIVTDEDYSLSGTSWTEVGTGVCRFLLSGEWGAGWWQFEVTAQSDAEPNDAEVKLQYYDESLAAWYDVPGSLMVIPAAAVDRYLSYPLSLIRSMHEFRVVRRQPSEITTHTFKMRVFNSYGGDVTL